MLTISPGSDSLRRRQGRPDSRGSCDGRYGDVHAHAAVLHRLHRLRTHGPHHGVVPEAVEHGLYASRRLREGAGAKAPIEATQFSDCRTGLGWRWRRMDHHRFDQPALALTGRLPGHGTRPGKRQAWGLNALSHRPCRLASRSNLPHPPVIPEGGWSVRRGGGTRRGGSQSFESYVVHYIVRARCSERRRRCGFGLR